MRITISSRFHPFSHVPGEKFLFPETACTVQIFPTRLVLAEEGGASATLDFSWKGLVREFTAKMDLEKKELTVFGFAKEGYFSYRIIRKEKTLILIVDKVPASIFAMTLFSVPVPLAKGVEIVLLTLRLVQKERNQGRLSLGSHKAQDFSLMRKRLDLCELVPLWIKMGGLCPEIESNEKEGPFALLASLEKEKSLSSALLFFIAAFSGVFVPRLQDEEHQGLIDGNATGSPLSLLTCSCDILSSFFYRKEGDTLFLLPLLPKEFHSGRWVDILLSQGGCLSFEWTKGKLKQVVIRTTQMQELTLVVPKEFSTCRLTRSKGMVKKVQIEHRKVFLSLQEREQVVLDRFYT